MVELTSRERVRLALNHEEPDRVPIFFGAEGATTMLVPAYQTMQRHLELKEPNEPAVYSRCCQYARIDEEAMAHFQSDVRPLVGPASSRYADVEGEGDSFTDYLGVTWARPVGQLYYAMTAHPLRDARTPQDILDHPWPSGADLLDLSGLAERSRCLHKSSPYAIVGTHEGITSVFELSWYMRGFEEFMLDLAAAPEMAHTLLRCLTDLAKETTASYLGEVGPYIDIVRVGDDLGTQNSLLLSPRMFRRMLKPYLAEYYSMIHDLTDAALMMHSCGNIYPLLGDLIEIGVEVINPVQVSAPDMNPEVLKREFGDQLVFCGGIDTHRVLPYGTPEEVRQEVRLRIRQMAPGGGYLLGAVHAIQPDVPPENACAMFEAALEYGSYPIE